MRLAQGSLPTRRKNRFLTDFSPGNFRRNFRKIRKPLPLNEINRSLFHSERSERHYVYP